MKNLKRCKVVMLPTKEKAEFPLFIDTSKANTLRANKGQNKDKWNYNVAIPQHLYFLSNDEIKENDYVLFNFKINPVIGIVKIETYVDIEFYTINNQLLPVGVKPNKVIATTDTSLNLPQPSQSFINKYINTYNNGNKIEEIMVEYEFENYQEELYEKETSNIGIRVLKVDKNNCITIKRIKDSWNEDEIKSLYQKRIVEYLNSVKNEFVPNLHILIKDTNIHYNHDKEYYCITEDN